MIKRLILFLLMGVSLSAGAQESFSDYFADSTLHISMDVSADGKSLAFTNIVFDVRSGWAGPQILGAEPFSQAGCRITMKSLGNDKLIYSNCYSTLMEEWLQLPESDNGAVSCSQSFRMPFPIYPVLIEIQRRNADGAYEAVMSQEFHPSNRDYRDLAQMPYISKSLLKNGDPHDCVDIVILSEGFTRQEMRRFDSICNLFVDHLFKYEPFKQNADKFNVSMVYVPSMRSGVSNTGFQLPTFLGFQYGMFGMERYIGTWTQYTLMLAAAGVPYDHIVVFANSDVYGGGGIYNQYAVFAAHNFETLPGIIHEFGHSFANLDDEYEGDVFNSKEVPGSKCIMRTLSEKRFCPKCQKQIKKAIDYWSE